MNISQIAKIHGPHTLGYLGYLFDNDVPISSLNPLRLMDGLAHISPVAELYVYLIQRKTYRSTSNFGSENPTQRINKLEELTGPVPGDQRFKESQHRVLKRSYLLQAVARLLPI